MYALAKLISCILVSKIRNNEHGAKVRNFIKLQWSFCHLKRKECPIKYEGYFLIYLKAEINAAFAFKNRMVLNFEIPFWIQSKN